MAAATDRPVLLYLAAPGWDGTFTANSAALQQLVESGFVAVRVDPFKRPDLALRYSPGGWPALVLLMPDGHVFAAAVDVPPQNARLYLRRLLQAFRTRRPLLEQKIVQADAHGSPAYSLEVHAVYGACVAAFDSVGGGFGSGVKFPEPMTLAFLQEFARKQPDSSAEHMVRQTLLRIRVTPIWDRDRGGIYAFSYTPDWRAPAMEKDAADQALMLLVLLDESLDDDGEAESMARQLLRYVRSELYESGSGAFHGRQVRAADAVWWTDPHIYAGRHALLTRAMAVAATRMRDPELADIALRSADYLLTACMDSTGGIRHLCQQGGATGLLSDQALAGLALLQVAALHGDSRLERGARKIAAYMRTRLSGPRAAFRDRPSQMELAGLPAKPIFAYMDRSVPAGNAVAAEFLAALGDRQRAEAILREARLQHPPSRRYSGMGRILLVISARTP